MSRRWTVATIAIVTVLSAAALLLVDGLHVWLRAALGVPFALLLPGAGALLTWDARGRLGRLEWFALSVGTSIALTMFAGMLLAATVGLTAERTIAALAAATLLMLVVAWTRSVPEGHESGARSGSMGRLATAALGLLAGALLVLLLSLPRPVASGPGTVQLWAAPDASGGVRISARNVDAASRRYHLTVAQGGGTITRQEIDMPIGTERVFEVRASATWTKSAPVTAELTDDSGALPPRSISVWTNQ